MKKIISDNPLFNKLRLNSRDKIKMKGEREVYWRLILIEYEYFINKSLS